MWKPRKHKHGGCNWVPMMCRIVASPPIWILGSYTGGYAGPLLFPNSRFDGSGENYRLQTTRIGPAHVEIARPQPNWTQQGAKPLTNRGISTCFRSGRLMAFCENYRRAKHFPRMEMFFPGRQKELSPRIVRAAHQSSQPPGLALS